MSEKTKTKKKKNTYSLCYAKHISTQLREEKTQKKKKKKSGKISKNPKWS